MGAYLIISQKIVISLIAGIMTLCLSVGLYAQSSEKELDQVELYKQKVGTWKWLEAGPDTTYLNTIRPQGKGFVLTGERIVKGEKPVKLDNMTLIGFSKDKSLIVNVQLLHDGSARIHIGKFVSENKLVMEEFLPENLSHAVALREMILTTPTTMSFTHNFRGPRFTWEPSYSWKSNFEKVKA